MSIYWHLHLSDIWDKLLATFSFKTLESFCLFNIFSYVFSWLCTMTRSITSINCEILSTGTIYIEMPL